MQSNVRVDRNAAFLRLPPSVRPGLLLTAMSLATSEVRTAKPRPDCVQALILTLN